MHWCIFSAIDSQGAVAVMILGLGLFFGLVVESFVWCFSFIFIFSSFGVLVCLLSLNLPYDKYIYVMVFLSLLIILTSSFNLGISSVSWV